jgi:hypothetical protein
MTIRYADGRTYEAVLLSRTETTLRVAAKGTDDVQAFTDVHGTWVSEDCEPVRIDFEWQRHSGEQAVAEADCICPAELASRLLYLLFSGTDDDGVKADALMDGAREQAANHLIV